MPKRKGLGCVNREHTGAHSVKTDFPPAEHPANYSANYPAKPSANKKCRYPALAKHPVRARGSANCQIFGHFWANVRQF